LVRADDSVEELSTEPDWPLGAFERIRAFRRHQRRLHDGDRLVLYSDGIARRRTRTGLFGATGIVRAVTGADSRSATATARAIQEAVVSASEEALPDDAAVIVLAVAGEGGSRADLETDADAPLPLPPLARGRPRPQRTTPDIVTSQTAERTAARSGCGPRELFARGPCSKLLDQQQRQRRPSQEPLSSRGVVPR
jgi:hypothetical protein